MMERRAAQESSIDLIEAGQFLAAEEIFAERRTNDPMEMVVRGEVEMYFGRLDAAEALLNEVAPRAQEMDVAARLSLASGRLAIRREDYERANIHLQTAYYIYNFQQEEFRTSQTLLELGRQARLTGDLDTAETRLTAATDCIKGRTSKRSEFLRGLIASEQAALWSDRGEVEQALESYTSSARMLKNTEKGRYYGGALLGLAELRCSMGEYQESLEIYKEANTVFERYDVKGDIAAGGLALATALLRTGRLERAERMAQESKEMIRGYPSHEGASLALLALVKLKGERLDEALQDATAAVELAGADASTGSRVWSRVILGQVKLAEREFEEAARILGEAAEIAGANGSMFNLKDHPEYSASSRIRALQAEAVIYLAEAYHRVDTRAGRVELSRAADILTTIQDDWLNKEYDRVFLKYEEQIVFTDDNRLVFDGNQLPRWQEAKRTLEGFLLRNALRQTNNSLTRAARKLGVSKVHVHNLKKKHNI